MDAQKYQQFQTYVAELKEIIQKEGTVLEGNCVYEHQSLNERPELLNKQKNLFEAGRRVKQTLLEIGFNAGHSALLFAMAAPPGTNFQFFDLGEHPYVVPCFNWLSSKFPQHTFQLHLGDSRQTLHKWITEHPDEKYDVVHIDGGHDLSCVQNDVNAAIQLCKPGGIMILDDTNDPMIAEFGRLMVDKNYAIPVEFELPTQLYEHKIYYRV